jgi:hypothetical protein
MASIATAEDASSNLLCSLNPYIEGVVLVPHSDFPHFMELPVKIRYKVYEEYFLDESSSIACENWPDLRFTDFSISIFQRTREHAPFLPKLCLASKMLQPELLRCLIEAAHFDFEDGYSLTVVGCLLMRPAMALNKHVRRMRLVDSTGTRGEVLYKFDIMRNEYLEPPLEENIEISNEIMPQLPGLRELHLGFHAPLEYPGNKFQYDRLDPIRALPIDKYLVTEYDVVEMLLKIKELQKVTIFGRSGNSNRSEDVILHGNPIIDDGRFQNLDALDVLCWDIKDAFDDKGRNLELNCYMTCGEEECIKFIYDDKERHECFTSPEEST